MSYKMTHAIMSHFEALLINSRTHFSHFRNPFKNQQVAKFKTWFLQNLDFVIRKYFILFKYNESPDLGTKPDLLTDQGGTKNSQIGHMEDLRKQKAKFRTFEPILENIVWLKIHYEIPLRLDLWTFTRFVDTTRFVDEFFGNDLFRYVYFLSY